MTAPSPNLLLVEDHLAVRRGLELLLRDEGFSIIGTTDSATEAVGLVERRRPDVVLLDLRLRDGDGLDLARSLRGLPHAPALLVHTGMIDAAGVRAAREAGVAGIALKTAPATELVAAIQTVAAGGRYIDPSLSSVLGSIALEQSRPYVLSPREREIFTLLLRGRSGAEAADELDLSNETVRTHIRNAARKLEATTRVHAVAEALRRGEIDLTDVN